VAPPPRALTEWGRVLHDTAVAAALVDHLLPHLLDRLAKTIHELRVWARRRQPAHDLIPSVEVIRLMASPSPTSS